MIKYQTTIKDNIHSHERYETLKNALSKYENQDAIEFTKNSLSGKFGFLCQYDRKKGMDTVWSSIYSLSEKKVYIAEGNPSRKVFKEDKRLKFL